MFSITYLNRIPGKVGILLVPAGNKVLAVYIEQLLRTGVVMHCEMLLPLIERVHGKGPVNRDMKLRLCVHKYCKREKT